MIIVSHDLSNHDATAMTSIESRLSMYYIVIILKLIHLVASSSLISKSYYLDQLNHPISQQSRQYLRHKPQLMPRSPSLFLHQETDSFSIYLSCESDGSDCQFVLDHLARASKRIENVLLIRNRIRINATVTIE